MSLPTFFTQISYARVKKSWPSVTTPWLLEGGQMPQTCWIVLVSRIHTRQTKWLFLRLRVVVKHVQNFCWSCSHKQQHGCSWCLNSSVFSEFSRAFQCLSEIVSCMFACARRIRFVLTDNIWTDGFLLLLMTRINKRWNQLKAEWNNLVIFVGILNCYIWDSKHLLWSFVFSSIYNLLFINLERWISLMFPLFHKMSLK